MIHYHGTPVTPISEREKLAGLCFCVSFSRPVDGDWCLRNAQSIMWDNGAFSIWKSKKKLDLGAFAAWVEPRLAPPHWAVVPDVIGGELADNLAMIDAWPHRRDLSAVVWHLNEPIDHLLRLADFGFGKICFGSTGDFDPVGCENWARRADEAFNALARRFSPLPWIHGLRALNLGGDRWPFASVDSSSVARNHARDAVCIERMARNFDKRQAPIRWTLAAEQGGLFDA